MLTQELQDNNGKNCLRKQITAASITGRFYNINYMSYNFKNKKILITGSTSGLGLVCAKNFIDKKATVYVCGRKKRNLALLKKDKSNKIYSFCGDLLVKKKFLKFI